MSFYFKTPQTRMNRASSCSKNSYYTLERYGVLRMSVLNKLRYTGVPAVPRLIHRSVPVERYGVLSAYLYFLLYYEFNQDVLRVLLSQDCLTNRRYYYETVPQPVIPTIEDIISTQNITVLFLLRRRFSCLWYCFVADTVAGLLSLLSTIAFCAQVLNSDLWCKEYAPRCYQTIRLCLMRQDTAKKPLKGGDGHHAIPMARSYGLTAYRRKKAQRLGWAIIKCRSENKTRWRRWRGKPRCTIESCRTLNFRDFAHYRTRKRRIKLRFQGVPLCFCKRACNE